MCIVAAFLLLVCASNCRGFNVDTEFPKVFSGPKGSYFGYSVALNWNSRGPVGLAGAPKANSTTILRDQFEPGALFSCDLTSPVTNDSCKEVEMRKGSRCTRNDNYFCYTDDMNGMWLGVSLDVQQNIAGNYTVVCGHLWENTNVLRKQELLKYVVNGVCYVMNSELNGVNKLLPLVQTNRQFRFSKGFLVFDFAVGQAGMSATFSEVSSYLIIGAPGIRRWKGGAVIYASDYDTWNRGYKRDRDTYDENLWSPYQTNDSYFGYSVTSGKFFEIDQYQYAVGAPRDASNHGKVYIISRTYSSSSVKDTKEGLQTGEYFGASVLGVDITGNNFTDLLIGAPLHSTESDGDEGKVYVYLSNGTNLIKQAEFEGDGKPGARFGTAIVNIGDINQDGYKDVAVGAPYEEGRGAVYIYHGSKQGLHSRFKQKIKASAIDGRLSGFGIHISRGLDVDSNGYPDILVGSYASSQAVLFRSRPVIKVNPSMIVDPKQINMNVTCENSVLSCVVINSCLSYTGDHVPSALNFTFSVKIQDYGSRAFFENTSIDTESTVNMEISRGEKECLNNSMLIRDEIKDKITPIRVVFSHELNSATSSNSAFDKTVPVYHPDSIVTISSEIPFHLGCKSNDECFSNLKVSARRTDPPESVKRITLGSVSNVSVDISIGNDGESAYRSQLLIYIPEEISIINQDICESGGQERNASLICDIGNPLRNETQAKIHIKLDTREIPPSIKDLTIDFEVVTDSNDTDFADNKATLLLHFETVYDIGVTGISSSDQIIYNGTVNASTVVSHTYIVKNHGPSPLETISFSLDVPVGLVTSDGNATFLTFIRLNTETRPPLSVPVSCDDTLIRKPLENEEDFGSISSKNRKKRSNHLQRIAIETNQTIDVMQQEKADKNETGPHKREAIRISCDNGDFRCVTLRCSAYSLSDPTKYAEISVSLYVNFTVVDELLSPWYGLQLITNSSITVEESDVMAQNIHPDAAQVQTFILHEQPRLPEEMQSWIIYVSIGVGVLLLLIITILLIKIGFFKRKDKVKLQRRLTESKKEKSKDDEKVMEKETVSTDHEHLE